MSKLKKAVESLSKNSKQQREWYEFFITNYFELLNHGTIPVAIQHKQEQLSSLIEAYVLDVTENHLIFSDYLGEFAMKLAGATDKKYMGQCFTPSDISQLIDRLQNAYKNNDKQPAAYMEPCCGSGSITLAFLGGQLERKGHFEDIYCFLMDLDEFQCKTAVIQILVSSMISGVKPPYLDVVVGNVLTCDKIREHRLIFSNVPAHHSIFDVKPLWTINQGDTEYTQPELDSNYQQEVC